MIDLNNLDLATAGDSGFDLQLLHPVDKSELEGMKIRIRGDKSKTVAAFDRKRINELQQKERVLKGKNKELTFTTDELEKMAVEAAAVRVISWQGISEGGMVLDCTPENITHVMTKYSWMRDQVREASEELENFRPD